MVLGNKEAGYEAAGVHCTFRGISVLWSSATDAQQKLSGCGGSAC